MAQAAPVAPVQPAVPQIRPEAPPVQASTNDGTTLVSFPPDTARITVRLPASAKLYVDDVLCPLPSETRAFTTPKLDAGRRYFYTLRMENEQNGQITRESRRVVITPGEHAQVDFRAPAPLETVQR